MRNERMQRVCFRLSFVMFESVINWPLCSLHCTVKSICTNTRAIAAHSVPHASERLTFAVNGKRLENGMTVNIRSIHEYVEY